MGWFHDWLMRMKKDHEPHEFLPAPTLHKDEFIEPEPVISEPVYSLVKELEDESKWHVACDPYWSVLTYSHWHHDLSVSFSPARSIYNKGANFHCGANWMTQAEKEYVAVEHDRILHERSEVKKKKDRDAFRVLIKTDE